MSLSQTYVVAHTARAKLAREASQPDHNLRRLVGHANLLDSLMCELAEAEREQERWFHDTVNGAVEASDEAKHVEWADTIIEEPAEDWTAEDAYSDTDSESDSDAEVDEDDVQVQQVGLRISPSSRGRPSPKAPLASHPDVTVTVVSVDDHDEEDSEYEDDEAESGDLALVRTRSHPPPDLLHDSEDDESSDDDDAGMPPSPPQPVLHRFSEAERKAISTTSYYDDQNIIPATASRQRDGAGENPPSLFVENYFASAQPTPAAIAAC